MFQTILSAFLIGGSTGIITHIMRNNKTILLPRFKKRPKGVFLGFLGDFLAGGAAAVFAVTYLIPETDTLRTLIGISILAGLSAENVLLTRQLSVAQHRNNRTDQLLENDIENKRP
ncbi:DUF4257 domain-containing protein [Priestia koreensis]|uniref:DUF4257 domain-containing protein n=1 Tax=Priestia koreensis TaxID=284581 RepID=UPI003458DE51